MKNKENILIIKHGAFGDLIQADGIFKSIRYKHKNAKITLLTSKNFINLMTMCPYVDNILIDDRPSVFYIFFYISLCKKIKKYNFSVIYDLQNSQRTYIYRKYLFSQLKWISTNRRDHEVSGLRGLMDMLKDNSVDIRDALKPNISWLVGDIKELLKNNKIPSKYIVLLPGSSKNHLLKRWPYFKELAQKLILKKYQVVTILGPEEVEFENLMPGHILKNMDWSQLAGVIQKSYFVIGNDSGPSHIASCLNKDGLALFGPSTSANRSELKRGRFGVLKTNNFYNLTVEAVIKKMEIKLQNN